MFWYSTVIFVVSVRIIDKAPTGMSGKNTAYNNRLNQVIDDHKGIIYKVSNLYCRNDEDRKDLVQEIIIQIWKSLERYDEQFRMSTWIYRISLNVAISYYRKHKTRKEKSRPLSRDVLQVEEEHDHRQEELNIRLLYRYIQELNELDRALMMLHLDGRSYRDAAEILGISETNVATKISRIKNLLRKKFLQYNPEHHENE
jgi:RNA polymerase sigma-70 factor (ECF subfamily)